MPLNWRRWMTLALALLATVPAIYLSDAVRRYAVEVPAWDDWEMAPIIVHARSGTLTFREIFEQQEEARTVLPKLIFILLARTGAWDVRSEMALSIIFCVLTAGGLYLLLRRSGLDGISGGVALALISILIFSPAQYEVWLLASGFPSFMPALFLTASLLVLTSRVSTKIKVTVSLCLTLASSFTLPHGLLAWGLTFPVFCCWERARGWRRWLVAWFVFCAVCAGCYFVGYQKPEGVPAFAPSVPLSDYFQYVLVFFGSPLGRWAKAPLNVWFSLFIGLALVGLYLISGLTAVKHRNESGYLKSTMPWLALGGYSLGSAGLAALGRVGFGVTQALESRYVPFSLYLTVSVIALMAISANQHATNKHSWPRSLTYTTWTALVLGCLVLPYFSFGPSMFQLRLLSKRNHLAHGAVLFSQVLDTSRIIKSVNYPQPGIVRERAAVLDALQMLRPRLLQNDHLHLIDHEIANGVTVSGKCEGVRALDTNSCEATGWAVLNSRQRPADCVVLAYEVSGNDKVLFAISEGVSGRKDIGRSLHDKQSYVWAGWRMRFDRSAIPVGATISAWAVDADLPKLYQLAQTLPLPDR